MSLYPNKIKVNGIRCGMILRGEANGAYRLLFEREFATPEQIETISWNAPRVEYASGYAQAKLPEGYGFELADIQYQHDTKSYMVTLRTAAQYLGDVTGYQEQIETLENTVSTLTEKAVDLTEKNTALEEQASMLAELEAAYDEL